MELETVESSVRLPESAPAPLGVLLITSRVAPGGVQPRDYGDAPATLREKLSQAGATVKVIEGADYDATLDALGTGRFNVLLYLGQGGVAQAMTPGGLFIDMSTISAATARKVAATLAEKGVEALDAPVSGGEVGAINASLSIMVGGPETAFARAQPIFQALGKNIIHIGPAGAGQVAKSCNQITCAVTLQGVAEALVLAEKAGVDPAKVRQALLGGLAASRILELHGQRILDRDYKPGFKVKLHRKDLGIALNAGREFGAPLLASSLVAELMDALMAMGQAEADHSALAWLERRLAGLAES